MFEDRAYVKWHVIQLEVLASMTATDTHLGKTANLAPAVEVTAHTASL